MQRYEQLTDILQSAKPSFALEIGTWKGDRALQILKHSDYYFGVDLFEAATEEDDKREFNVKPHYTMADVAIRIKRAGYNNFCLIQGRSDHCLVGLNIPMDFIFIDGGHSVPTIQSDLAQAFKLSKPGTIIILDDYYTDRESDAVGCNSVIKDYKYEILPAADHVTGGGKVQFAKIVFGEH